MGVVIQIDVLVLNLLMLMTAGHRLVVVSLIILLLLDGLLIDLIDSSCLHRLLERLLMLILVGILLVWLLLL